MAGAPPAASRLVAPGEEQLRLLYADITAEDRERERALKKARKLHDDWEAFLVEALQLVFPNESPIPRLEAMTAPVKFSWLQDAGAVNWDLAIGCLVTIMLRFYSDGGGSADAAVDGDNDAVFAEMLRADCERAKDIYTYSKRLLRVLSTEEEEEASKGG